MCQSSNYTHYKGRYRPAKIEQPFGVSEAVFQDRSPFAGLLKWEVKVQGIVIEVKCS